MTKITTDIAIIGAGLSGLALARQLQAAGADYHLFDARARTGGRILSPALTTGGSIDQGPAWIWPHNHRILKILKSLNIPTHGQFARGNLVLEDQNGTLRRDLEFATMGDALRVAGGTGRLTDALADDLPRDRVHLNHQITAIDRTHDGAAITGTSPVQAARVVLALPPRLAAQTITFTPTPPPDVLAQMTEIPTWMAGHAKFIAVYDTMHWRDIGLSGDAISHIGPLVEVHDASDEITHAAALFGFVAPSTDLSDIESFTTRAIAQLGRLYGPWAAQPTETILKNWAHDPFTATSHDAIPPRAHPAYGLPRAVQSWAGERILFAGTEAAHADGGFLEGALEAAETVFAALK
jgi:monoamine oxidase